MQPKDSRVRVLHLISSIGFYGAERWIVALARNADLEAVEMSVANLSEKESENSQFEESLPEAVRYVDVLMSGRYDFRVIGKLKALIESLDIQIVHSHGYKSDILAIIVARLTKIVCISTPHGFSDKVDMKLRWYIRLGMIALRRFDRVVPLSIELVHELERGRVASDRITYIPNGVDLSEIVPRNHADLEGGFKVGYVGQLIKRKNVGEIIDAFNCLHARNGEPMCLEIIGEGDEMARLKSQADSVVAGKDVHFLGFRPDRLECMRSFNVFVMTSSYEGVPRAMMEAMAMGVPVVAYDIPGVDELITNNETGLLCPFGDGEALTTLLERLLVNPSLAERLGSAGQGKIELKFSALSMASSYGKLYEKVVNQL